MDAPICWVGGKSRLRKTIIERIPEHVCYVEVFGGAGWVLFGKEQSKSEVYNDIDGELVNFFRVVKNCHKAFLQAYEWILVSRKMFRDFIEAKPEELDEIQRAVRFFYIVRASFGGKWKGASFGYSRTEKAHFNLDNVEGIVKGVYDRLRRVTIEECSFEKVVERYDSKDTFFYLDPPYYNIFFYKHNFIQEDFDRMSEVLAGIKGRFIMSLNDCEEVRKMFARYRIEEVYVRYSIAKLEDKSGELLIRNY